MMLRLKLLSKFCLKSAKLKPSAKNMDVFKRRCPKGLTKNSPVAIQVFINKPQ